MFWVKETSDSISNNSIESKTLKLEVAYMVFVYGILNESGGPI